MQKAIMISSVLALFTSLGLAQEPNPTSTPPPEQALQVRLVNTVAIPAEFGSGSLFRDPSRCDAEGNIYFHRVVADMGARDPIKKVNARGETNASFDIGQIEKDFVIGDYFVSKDGVVTVVGYRQGERDILGTLVATYSSNGSLKSVAKLDGPRLSPTMIGVFENGEYLISGTILLDQKGGKETPDANADRVPTLHEYAAIFKDDGSLVKELTLGEDEHIEDAIRTRDRAFVGEVERLAFAGVIVAGEDGNLYLSRRTSPAIVYVISPSGNVERTLKINPPEPGMMPASIFARKGKIGVWFIAGTKGPGRIVMADRQTGEVTDTYDVEDKLGLTLACSTEQEFVFLGHEKGRMSLRIGSVQ